MIKSPLPFVPVQTEVALGISGKFPSLGAIVSKRLPGLEKDLKEAEINISKEVYGALIGLLFIFYFAVFFIVGFSLSSRFAPQMALQYGGLGGFIGGAFIAMQLVAYPKIVLKRKMRDIDRNLIFGLRTILVEIRAGVTLFDSIGIVAQANNGQLSKEFARSVKDIQTGTYQNQALENLGERNPSMHFKRSIWQLVNGLKSGGDIGNVMQSLVDSLSREKENQVKKYGNSLKMLSLVYMMLGAIIPALGMTFMIILSTLPSSNINEMAFYFLLGGVCIGQFMFLGVIKSSRPALLGD